VTLLNIHALSQSCSGLSFKKFDLVCLDYTGINATMCIFGTGNVIFGIIFKESLKNKIIEIQKMFIDSTIVFDIHQNL
jgi:hypothetical protein